MQPGDRVNYHIIYEHSCAGGVCRCQPDVLPASVVGEVVDDEYPAAMRPILVLEVDFPTDHHVGTKPVLDSLGNSHEATVTKHGYISRQSHCPRAGAVAASGSWSPLVAA